MGHGHMFGLLLVSLMIMNHSLIDEDLLRTIDSEIVPTCDEEPGVDWHTVSAFVEEVSASMKRVYVAEPARVSMISDESEEQLQALKGQWIEISFYRDRTACYEMDDVKTSEMRMKSEALLLQLREK